MAKNPMAEWNNTEELMLETLEDEPKDWYNINRLFTNTNIQQVNVTKT